MLCAYKPHGDLVNTQILTFRSAVRSEDVFNNLPVDANPHVSDVYAPHFEQQVTRRWGNCCDVCAMEGKMEKVDSEKLH